MASVITARTPRDIYPKVVKNALQLERPNSSPRGMPTRDLGLIILDMMSPFNALPTDCGRQLNGRIAVIEALQLVAGYVNTDLTTWASKTMAELTLDENGRQHGAYGRRIGNQLHRVVEKFVADPSTRQAHVTLWDPMLDNVPGLKDYPCTSSITFSIRSRDPNDLGALDMTVFMRSNDIFLGLPYDLFQFGQLQMSLARVLGIIPGRYRHIANSMHLYERDVRKAELIKSPTGEPDWQPRGIGGNEPTYDWSTAADSAMSILLAPSVPVVAGTDRNFTNSENWFAEVMKPFYMKEDVPA